MPLALAAASPRRSGCRLSSRLRSWKAKLKSWMLNIRVLCTGIRGERRQAGRRASPASAGAALVSTSSLDTTTPSVVGGGECAGSVAGRGPVGSGPGGQAARVCRLRGEIRKFRGPHPLAHSTIVFSFSGSHEWCHSTPQHHSLLLRRPMSVCTCKSAVSSWSCSYTRVSLSPWCARAQSYNRGSRRPRGACAHSRPLPAQPRSLPHAKCASATARKGPDEPQWRLSLRKPRRASHASQAGRRGSLCSQPSPWVQWELLRRCPCCRRPPP